jgi:hypothetical protein
VRHGLLTAGVLVAAAAGCSGDISALVHDIHGDWRFTEHLEAASLGLVCDDSAKVSVTQSGASFSVGGTQSGVCRVAGGDSISNVGGVSAQDGRIAGSTLTFDYGGCRYSGAIAADNAAMNGTAQCAVVTPGGSGTAMGTWRMLRADITPPAVTARVRAGVLTHGDTLWVSVQGDDSTALAYLGDSVAYDPVVYSLDCPRSLPAARDSGAVSGRFAERSFAQVIPGCTDYIRVTAFAVDTAGNRGTVTLNSFEIVLRVSQLAGSLDDSLYTLGDTVRISMTGTNERGLSWVGYRWYDPNFAGQDSVAVTGTTAAHVFQLPIPADGPVTELLVRVFARHRLGWLTEQDFLFARLTDAIRLPIERLTLPGAPNDITYAAGSDRLFLDDTGQAVVRVVGLAPFTLGATYNIGAPGASLDLSDSEDSILVALKGQLALGVVRVSTGAVGSVAITPPDLVGIYDARRVRVVGNGQAMALIGSGSAGDVVQLDLSNGVQRVRVPWSGYGTSERTGDRSRLLLMDGGSPVGDRLYLAASDTFLPPQSGVVSLFGTNAQVSADNLATTWLVSCQLLTADMAPLRTLSDPSVSFGPSAIAADGTRAYCGRQDGVVEFDVATGNRMRAVWLPGRPDYLKALPGNRLLAASGSTLYLVTLP